MKSKKVIQALTLRLATRIDKNKLGISYSTQIKKGQR